MEVSVRQTRTVRQEIVERDVPNCLDGLIESSLGIPQDPHLGQLRRVINDRVVQRKAAFLEQHQRGDSRHGFRHRRDPEDRVPFNGKSRGQVSTTEARGPDDAPAAPDQGRRAGDRSRVHVALNSGADGVYDGHAVSCFILNL